MYGAIPVTGRNGGAPSPSAGFCGLHLAKIPPSPKAALLVAVQREKYQKVTPSCET